MNLSLSNCYNAGIYVKTLKELEENDNFLINQRDIKGSLIILRRT
jgi:hypothetical protein